MAWILAVVLLYIVLVSTIAWVSLHPPRVPVFISPGSLGARQEEVEIGLKSGVRIRGWFVEATNAKAVMVLAHGYLMNRAELTPTAYRLWQEGVSCLLIDFRAHGKSGGTKSTMGNLEREDVREAVAYARSRCPGCKVGVLGSSMGSAAAALALGDDPTLADLLVLDSCYSRLSEAVLGWWRFLGGRLLMTVLWPTTFLAIPFAGFNPFAIDISRALASVGDVPVLLMHGDLDNLALPSEAQRNYEALPGPKRLVWFAGCGHSEGRWVRPELYYDELLGFLRENDFMD